MFSEEGEGERKEAGRKIGRRKRRRGRRGRRGRRRNNRAFPLPKNSTQRKKKSHMRTPMRYFQERDFTRNKPCWYLNYRFLASRAIISVI